MKIYPDADVWCFVEKPSCMTSYMKYPANHSWKIHNKTTEREMRYWRDTEGVKKAEITLEDLYFPDWPKSRIRKQACLGLLYATGNRFIRLTKAPPAGFKCAPMPVNLATARVVKENMAKKAKQDKADKKAGKNGAKDGAKDGSKDGAKDKKGEKKGKGKEKPKNDSKPGGIRSYADAEKA